VRPAGPGRGMRCLRHAPCAQGGNPTQVACRLFSEALYGKHPYARDVLGTADSVGDLDREALSAFYRDEYPLSNLTFAIVGDIDVDDVVARVTKRFSARRKSRPAATVPAPPVLDGKKAGEREVNRYLERAQANLVIGYPGATIDAADRFALEVLVSVLGGQSGRLFGELRDKQGLVYRVSAHSVEGVDPGFIAIYLSCAPDKLEAAVASVRSELTKIRDAGITADELERAKSYLVGSHQIAMQRRSSVANAIAYHEAYGLGWESWSKYEDMIRAVTVDDVAAAAQTYLREDRAITATVRPPIASPAAQKRSKTKAPPPPSKEPRPSKRAKPRSRRNA